MKNSRTRRNRTRHHQTARRGSTLMVVLVLMGMLSLLGVIFYTFSAQERSNAEYYSEAAKELEDPGLDADVLFDWALEQIIVGTDPRLKNSMLWGSRHSLISNAVGFSNHRPNPDTQAFNGEGVNVIYDVNTGALGVDQNRNGLIDDPTVNGAEPDNRYLLNYVDSPAAQSLTERQLTNGSFPQSDVGYTYPDINNVFLCYVGKVRDQNGNLHRVVKPSYLVPGLLRATATSAPNAFWYNSPTTGARVMRGHPNHLYVPPTSSPATPAPRYITDAQAPALTGAGTYGFPVSPMASTYDTTGGGLGPQLTTGRMGVYSLADPLGNPLNEPIEFDYDNDGDGINESILMDLDFPAQQDPTGKLFVPLFLVTIHDLDALINLNAHGNLAKILYGPGDAALATTNVSSGGSGLWFGTDSSDGNFYFISQSNLGLGPAEVNPCWVLNRRVGIDDVGVFTQHAAVFGNAPSQVTTGTLLWGESANMEYFWSKIGRYQTSPSVDLFVGVYGEPGVLYNASLGVNQPFSTPGGHYLPRPGLSLSDDNGDLGEGQGYFPYFQHPLDYTGLGSYMTGLKSIAFAVPGGTADPANRWIKYSRYNNSTAPRTILWGQNALLMPPALTMTQGLGDDPYEVAFYATDNRAVDSLLTADEMLYLQLNNNEIDRLNVTSRLANLVPFNFEKTKTKSLSRAESIRRKFTTQSNDRKNFSLPTSPSSTRFANEYSVDPNTGTFKFPPQFGTIPRYQTTALNEDPLRPQVRYLMEIEINGQQGINRPQRKLSLNSLLTGGATAPLIHRPLTPHPVDPGTGTVYPTYSATNLAPYPPASASTPALQLTSQEFWARRDRQQMARDIYVLLYLLGHGDDTKATATDSTVWTTAQCAEMAQFAVNLVDSMDRDSVITRFEYDTNLTNGWNLDDDPYSSPSTTPATLESAAERAEVFGIERQDLSISEAYAIRTAAITGDHALTNYPDSAQHHFAYVELYNQSPFDVTFTDSESWQVVMKQTGKFERRLSFKSSALTIPSGSRYTVGTIDADIGTASPGKSIFKVDVMSTGDFTQSSTFMAPYGQVISDATHKGLDLLDVTTPSNYYRIEDGTNNPPTDITGYGAWAAGLSSATAGSPIQFILRRRAHPTRSYMPPANDNDNPWVQIDEMDLTSGFSTFTLKTSTDTQMQVQAAVDAMTPGSKERPEPFGQASESNHSPSSVAGGKGNNSLSALNSNVSGGNFTVWQPHFDRDFASIIDLFYVPTFGPDQVTTHLMDTKIAPESQPVPYCGAAKFLNPNTATPNRWHRLLELVEVPTRTNHGLAVGSDIAIPRVPGRINLNMIRNPEVYAALLDDIRYFFLDMSVGTVPAGSDNPPYMLDNTGDVRDWWGQFLMSRDGVDQYAFAASGLTLSLPGLPGFSSMTSPGARPFRSLADVSYTAYGGTKTVSVEDTILRRLPMDTGATQRRLVEIGTSAEHGSSSVDPLIRNRLLSKIAGNTTTRSNNFAIFISVKYFNAAADPAYGGAIRIGGPYNGLPGPEHRGFFVVDRSKLEQGKYTGAANYDFRSFIDYRKTLQTQ